MEWEMTPPFKERQDNICSIPAGKDQMPKTARAA
jgi:hypothetical protein